MTAPAHLLVVDDERSSRENLYDLFTGEGHRVTLAADGVEALTLIRSHEFDAVLLDIQMPRMDGFTVLKHVHQESPQVPVVVFTAFGTTDHAMQAMKAGAYDYVTKPFDIEELLAILGRAVGYRRLNSEVQMLRERLTEAASGEFHPDHFVGRSPGMQAVYKMIGKVSPTDATVLLEGETGTGKELAANAIWYHSNRRDRPLMKINCAALPEGLLESELFGHERGAFTDAHAQRKGLFEAANGGTLVLDEIAEMSSSLQSKLLRVLEQGELRRVGGKEIIRVDVRIIASTNRHLEEEVRAGRFRKDLFYRLHVVHIVIPPLRERRGDVAVLAEYFLEKYGRKRSLVLSKEALEALSAYHWPGNVRELENMIERATVVAQGRVLTPEHLAFPAVAAPAGTGRLIVDGMPLRTALAELEREMIVRALEKTRWNRTKAAALLQIDRRVLFDKIREYQLKKE